MKEFFPKEMRTNEFKNEIDETKKIDNEIVRNDKKIENSLIFRNFKQ